MPDVSVLEVLLYGEKVATLTNVGGDRTLFAFTDDYVADDNRPLLGLGFKDSLGGLITEFKPTQTRLIPWFSNLLPEGHLRKYLAERANVKSEREFYMLWVLGQDLPGAIVVRPVDGEQLPPAAHERLGREPEDRSNLMRFSLAGVQLKFSAIEDARKGMTIPVRGVGGDWIVKLPSRQFERLPENEFSMMSLARDVGIDVPRIELIDVNGIEGLPEGVDKIGGQAFAIERFDRLSDGETVHIEDFAQIFGVYPADKYEKASMRNIATVIGAEGRDSDIEEFIRRLVFNVLIGNADMHVKNWSFIYPDRRNAAIAPAYDFVSTIHYLPDEYFALKFSKTKRFDEFTRDELAHMAGKARLPEKLVLDTAKETVAKFQEVWRSEKRNLPLTKKMIEDIDAHIGKVPIASE